MIFIRTYVKYLVIFLFVFLSCTNIKNLNEGGVRPKRKANFEFSKNPFSLGKNNSIIDTTAIYLCISQNNMLSENTEYHDSSQIAFLENINVPEYLIHRKPPDSLYHFYRFFSNGRVFISKVLNHFPSIEEQNNLRTGLIGYYKLEGNQLIVEEFFPINFGQYVKLYGTVKQDTIIFNKSDVLHPSDDKYIKTKKQGIFLYSAPDW